MYVCECMHVCIDACVCVYVHVHALDQSSSCIKNVCTGQMYNKIILKTHPHIID